ncbi:MAG: phospholipase [Solirubrobacteraceae bacterium]
MLDPARRLLGVTLRAPLQLPPGGQHWYVVPRVGFPEPVSFRASLALLGEWLDEQLELPLERTIVGGFSQGAVMSYAVALGDGRPSPAGVLALSGFVPTVPGFAISARPGLPVAISHGRDDPVIPVRFGREAEQQLRVGGFNVTWRETPGGHHIDPRLLPELRTWVEQVLDGG